ncbi:LacI family DNA-binding transcriptional regulator [uncultured Sunxiuqinia sp.]|uniref:LacI family DNA-binding transcriptional regulator n=1 Tax=uncultured Sunxiuqinia sp. TaxID=1573825 RepID=UPI0026081BDF|nr:LacI family DNA-binding transcriptional regulator [uncultured Sunxiuqinia sp.]
MTEYKNIRIKDIAQMAGVSVATVDRVLHKRGKISEKAFQKVMEALEKTGYKPNLMASTLGAKKKYKIAALVPNPLQDDYWNQSASGILNAISEWEQYNVQIETFYFNLYDRTSFIAMSRKVLSQRPDGVLLAPIFHQEANEFFDELKASSIPYVLFNTNIPNATPISFIGQDLYQSGRVGAEMLHTKLSEPGNIAVLHVYEAIQNGVHLSEKEKGFRDFFRDNRLDDFTILSYEFENTHESEFSRELMTIITRDKLKGIFVSTSKGAYLTASVIDQAGIKDIALVGYDLLKNNIHYVYDRVINYLINQNPRKQAFLGISYLVNYLLFRKVPPANVLFPLEVISRENIKSYLNSGLN